MRIVIPVINTIRPLAIGASTNALSERAVTYDLNGNILSLTRYGADTAVPEEALAYSYNGNMLAGVSNSGPSGGGGAYAHDANGNLTRDGLSGLDIGYDDLNLTSRIPSGDTTLAEYGHLADGTKISSANGSGNGLQYRGSLVYAQTAGQSGSPTLTLDCALTSAGRIACGTADDGSVSYRSLIHLRDHLGSVRAIIDGDTGTVLEANDYYPFGKRIPLPVSGAVPVTEALSVTEPVEVTAPVEATVASTGSATAATAPTSQNRRLFSGKESQSFLSASIPLLDFGARMYDPITARWTAQDPLAEKYYAVSPYAYCLGNPIRNVDILGFRPIYSTEGYLLRTDDGGIQGEQIIMKKENFMQGMLTEDALKYNLGVKGLDGEDAVNRFNESFNHLKDRPDWDGYITLEEANEWYRSGNGEPLFADINKIDFGNYVSLGEKYVGKTYVINLLNGKSRINDGLVYGKIVVKRYPNNGIRAYSDRYDFDIKKPYLLHLGRNIQTHIGAKVAGQGTAYNINIYGEKKLKPALPWIK